MLQSLEHAFLRSSGSQIPHNNLDLFDRRRYYSQKASVTRYTPRFGKIQVGIYVALPHTPDYGIFPDCTFKLFH
jgi:hypothetical protein